MERFREELKDHFIAEQGINPVEYDLLRGWKRVKVSNADYKYDAADRVFNRIADNIFRRKHQLRRTYWVLFHCYSVDGARNYLSDTSCKDGLEAKTIMKYYRRVVKAIEEEISGKKELREEIIRKIKDTYEKSRDRNSG